MEGDYEGVVQWVSLCSVPILYCMKWGHLLSFLWCSKEVPPSSTRDELRSYARHEFERNRNVTDLVSRMMVVHAIFLFLTETDVHLFSASYTVPDFGRSWLSSLLDFWIWYGCWRVYADGEDRIWYYEEIYRRADRLLTVWTHYAYIYPPPCVWYSHTSTQPAGSDITETKEVSKFPDPCRLYPQTRWYICTQMRE